MKALLLGLVAMTVLAAPAQAGFMSAYTELDLDQCLVLEADDFQVRWSCPGYKGYPLLVVEADLRFMLAYGFGADQQQLQSLPQFNYLGEKLEWRLSNDLGRWLPVASIVRYFTAGGTPEDPEGQTLVVTQLSEGRVCHIAYVDALANADANELARQAADKAGNFDCEKDEVARLGKVSP
jgi:hypothetical protein